MKTPEKRDNEEQLKSEQSIIVVRKYESKDKLEVQRIFSEGMLEMVRDTAFTGLPHHPESLLLYFALTIACVLISSCWWMIILLPAVVLCGRYFYSSRVIHIYLKHSMSTDMADIAGFYLKSPADSCLWVAVMDGKVVGLVAAVTQEQTSGVVELQRMSVDRRYRCCGVGMALGRKVLEFASTHGYSWVTLGTTAYQPAAHKLYKRLGFRCVGVTNAYRSPIAGTRPSLLEWLFYRVHYHHYSLKVENQ